MFYFFFCVYQSFDNLKNICTYSIGKREYNRTDLIQFKPYGLGPVTERLSNGWNMKSFRQHITDEGHLKVKGHSRLEVF